MSLKAKKQRRELKPGIYFWDGSLYSTVCLVRKEGERCFAYDSKGKRYAIGNVQIWEDSKLIQVSYSQLKPLTNDEREIILARSLNQLLILNGQMPQVFSKGQNPLERIV